MAQHDMNIANQGFPATRADLNNALQAIATNNSGTSAPSTTFANQWFYNETSNKLFIRNEANNAFIEVATLDQTNNEWQITTGVIQAKDGDGLALKTDDGTTRLFVVDSDGSIQFSDDIELIQAKKISFKHAAGGTTRAAISADSSDNLTFGTGSSGTTRMTLDTGGLVGIGKTPANNTVLDVQGSSSGTLRGMQIRNAAGDAGASLSLIWSLNRDAGSVEFEAGSIRVYKHQLWTSTPSTVDSYMTFNTIDNESTGEKMRLDSINGTGRLRVATGGEPSTSAAGVQLSNPTVTACRISSGSVVTAVTQLAFINGNGVVGRVETNGAATLYATSSDYRIKENIEDISDGITRVKQLAPKRFNFIADADTTVDGFLAHEAATIVPEAVSGEKDAMRDEEYIVTAAKGDLYTPAADAVLDEEGNEVSAATDEVIHSTDVAEPETLEEGQQWRETTAAVMGARTVPDYQGIDQSKLVPLLTAALQEAIAKIEALETRVATLEG